MPQSGDVLERSNSLTTFLRPGAVEKGKAGF